MLIDILEIKSLSNLFININTYLIHPNIELSNLPISFLT